MLCSIELRMIKVFMTSMSGPSELLSPAKKQCQRFNWKIAAQFENQASDVCKA